MVADWQRAAPEVLPLFSSSRKFPGSSIAPIPVISIADCSQGVEWSSSLAASGRQHQLATSDAIIGGTLRMVPACATGLSPVNVRFQGADRPST